MDGDAVLVPVTVVRINYQVFVNSAFSLAGTIEFLIFFANLRRALT